MSIIRPSEQIRRWLGRGHESSGDQESSGIRVRFPLGHYYSPVPDTNELAAEPVRSRVWPAQPRATVGIDWNDRGQIDLCARVFASQSRLELAVEPTDDARDFHTQNAMFPALDAWVLEGLLRYLRPARMIEVGCGFSSLITARVNRELLSGGIDVTCIDPNPPAVITDGVEGIRHVRVEKIQDTPLELFEQLVQDDVLFIDTSHTVKTGGDVPWIFQEVIPRLEVGVVVHIHDVFLPGDYPSEWVLDGWGWNEIYLVHAFLAFNTAFEVVYGAKWMELHARDVLLEAFPGLALPEHAARSGSSLWLRRVGR